MTVLELTARQLGYEQRIFRRNPAAVFFTFAFPLLLLVIFGSLNRGQHIDRLGGIAFNQYYVPAMAAFGVMSTCFANLAARFVYRRESGQLKRLRATPAPLAAVLGGFVLNALLVGALVTAVNIGVGVMFYDVTAPTEWLVFALVIIVGTTAFSALGIAFSTIVPNLESTDPMIFGVFMPIVFISGAFFPVPSSSPLARLAAVFPVHHLIQAAFTAFDPTAASTAIPWRHLTIVAVWGVAGAAIAVRRFRWEPNRA